MPTRTLAAPNGLILKHKHALHGAGLWRTQTALYVVVVRICPYADRAGRRRKRAAIFGVIEGHSGAVQAASAGNLQSSAAEIVCARLKRNIRATLRTVLDRNSTVVSARRKS